MDLITVETASRSIDLLCGLFVIMLSLIAAAAWCFTGMYARNAKRAKAAARRAEKAHKAVEAKMRDKGADSFVKDYETRKRIEDLNHRLLVAERENARLKDILERARISA
jgi:hypothetical protein